MKSYNKISIMLSLVLCMSILFGGVNIFAIDNNEQTKINNSYKYIQNILTDYYYAVDLNKQINFNDKSFSPIIKEYLSKKIKTEQKKFTIRGIDKENYKINFSLEDASIDNGYIKLCVNTVVEFNYIGCSLDSKYGELSQIILYQDNYGITLLDWYIVDDCYDIEARGELIQINKTSILQENNNKIIKKQDEIDRQYTTYYDSLDDETLSIEQDKIKPQSRANIYSLDRDSMVSYVNNNCGARYPSSGNGSVPYLDFSTISGSYDCTNFMSHALLSGGASVYDTGKSGIQGSGWYFRNSSNRSSSWSGVSNLYNFITTNKTKGPSGYHVAYNPFNMNSTPPYQRGDILQFHNGSIWRHSTMITGFTPVSPNSSMLEPLVTGRSSYTANPQMNVKTSSVYPGNSRRVIRLLGYYI